MFEVLAFVYENYWGGDSCPALPALQRKLNAVGFDSREVMSALLWLEDLKQAARQLKPSQTGSPRPKLLQPMPNLSGPMPDHLGPIATPVMRVFTPTEQRHLGTASWGWVVYLSSIGVLPQERLELVMDRVMAAPGDPVSVEDIKLIVLMVFWSLGEEPDALVLDELCDNRPVRLAS